MGHDDSYDYDAMMAWPLWPCSNSNSDDHGHGGLFRQFSGAICDIFVLSMRRGDLHGPILFQIDSSRAAQTPFCTRFFPMRAIETRHGSWGVDYAGGAREIPTDP